MSALFKVFTSEQRDVRIEVYKPTLDFEMDKKRVLPRMLRREQLLHSRTLVRTLELLNERQNEQLRSQNLQKVKTNFSKRHSVTTTPLS